MTVLSHDYNPKHKNIVFVLPKGEGRKHQLLKRFVKEIKDHHLQTTYNIFFAEDFIRIKHHRTETANEFKVRHNIYTENTGRGYFLRVSEGMFMEKNGQLEAFDMNYPTAHSGKDLAPAQFIRINLLVPIKEPPLDYLLATRKNDIDALGLLKPFKQVKGKLHMRMVSYKDLNLMLAHKSMSKAIKYVLSEPERNLRPETNVAIQKKIREGQASAKEELKKMGLEVRE